MGLGIIWDWFIGLVRAVTANVAAFFAGFTYGSIKEKKKQSDEELEAMQDAKAIRDRLKRDPDFTKRVRDRFTR